MLTLFMKFIFHILKNIKGDYLHCGVQREKKDLFYLVKYGENNKPASRKMQKIQELFTFSLTKTDCANNGSFVYEQFSFSSWPFTG